MIAQVRRTSAELGRSGRGGKRGNPLRNLNPTRMNYYTDPHVQSRMDGIGAMMPPAPEIHAPFGPLVRRHPLYTAPYPAQLYFGSEEEEAQRYEDAGECVVMTPHGGQYGGTSLIRPGTVNRLKAKGWVTRVDVAPARGGINVKTTQLCPAPAMGYLRVENRRMAAPIRLAQGPARIRVVVKDRRNEPAAGIGVVVLAPGNVGEGTTDSDGVVVVDIPAGVNEATVLANLPEGEVRKRVLVAPLGMQTVTFHSIRKVNGPFITPTEGIAAGAGVFLTVLGAVISRKTKVVGEVFSAIGGAGVIASAYSVVNRHI